MTEQGGSTSRTRLDKLEANINKLADLAEKLEMLVIADERRCQELEKKNQELEVRLHHDEQRRPPIRVNGSVPDNAQGTLNGEAPTPAPRRQPPVRANAEAPKPAPWLGSASASNHSSLVVVTESSADNGGGDKFTPPDTSNHSSSSNESNPSVCNGVDPLLKKMDPGILQSNSSLQGMGVELGAVHHLGTGSTGVKELGALPDELLGGRSGTDGIQLGEGVLSSKDLNSLSLSLSDDKAGISCLDKTTEDPLLGSSGIEDGPRGGGWVLLPVLPRPDGPGPSPSKGGNEQFRKLSMAVATTGLPGPSHGMIGAGQYRSHPKWDRNRTLRPDLSLSYLKVPDRGKKWT